MSERELEREVKALIRFYEKRGWDWTVAAAFTLCRGLGMLPCYWRRYGL